MNYAKIENGLITNIIVADADFATEHGLIECSTYIDNQAVSIGWKYNGTTFTQPDPVSEPIVIESTKEELLAQLAVLTAKINALGA
jgi:hypothetical protein